MGLRRAACEICASVTVGHVADLGTDHGTGIMRRAGALALREAVRRPLPEAAHAEVAVITVPPATARKAIERGLRS